MFERRAFLKGAVAGSTLFSISTLAQKLNDSQLFWAAIQAGKDDLGVASGDPEAHAVTLWTALPGRSPLRNKPRTEVLFEVSLTPEFTQASIVSRGRTVTGPEWDHTVKVRVGGLQPATTYYYRFQSADGGSYRSVIGRTKTTPKPGDNVTSLRFAFVTCQDFTNGYYTVYQALAEDSPDFCVHLGDTIYETGLAKFQRAQIRKDNIGGGIATTLEHYRAKHRLYLSDPAWRGVRALFPWIILWDDHEAWNNYAGAHMSPAELVTRTAGYRAFLEYMPVQVSAEHATAPQLYRTVSYGNLLEGFALDERQYRQGSACKRDHLTPDCEAVRSTDRSLLGTAQRTWLKNKLAESPARWKVLFNEIVMMPFRVLNLPSGLQQAASALFNEPARGSTGVYLNLDSWDGFPAEREDLLSHVSSKGIENLVVITGDIHNAYAGEIRLGTPGGKAEKSVAVELVTPSVTSARLPQLVNNWPLAKALQGALRASNPHLLYSELEHHGYVQVTLTHTQATVRYIAVESVTQPQSRAFVLKEFQIPAGKSQLIG